jgi:Lrp/AsnC family leucine-responsive transcriptional regulator
MDNTDILILKILQKNARISMKDLGKKVNLTSPAVTERVRKLEDKKIIEGYKAIISPKKLGLIVETYTSVALHPSKINTFKTLVKQEPAIIECHRITGNDSMTIRILAEDTSELEILLEKIQKLGTTKSSIILSTILDNKLILPRSNTNENNS